MTLRVYAGQVFIDERTLGDVVLGGGNTCLLVYMLWFCDVFWWLVQQERAQRNPVSDIYASLSYHYCSMIVPQEATLECKEPQN